jgi:RHS repeat-associated protein
MTRPNGVNTNYTYDAVSHLLSVLHQAGNTTLDGASYGYDYAGNRTSKTNYLNGITEGYNYDLIYQLTQVAQGPTTTESYSYDAVGNRLSSLGVPSYSYNPSNELTASSNGSYTYDANGNTLSDPSGKQYTWDFENRLTQAVVPGTNGGTTTFKYDPFGRRIQKSGPLGTTNYLYDVFDLLEDTGTSGGVVASYTQSDQIDQPLAMIRGGAASYFQADGLGTITSLSNQVGSIPRTYGYDSFGKVTGSTGTLANDLQYTARELDPETGLYFYRARYYDASLGRFVSEDPIRFKGGDDFFRYTGNDPVDYGDPFGLESSAPQMAPCTATPSVPDPTPTTPATPGAAVCWWCIPLIILGNPTELNSGEQEWINQQHRQREYDAYKKRCNEPPPNGLSPCDLARWKLRRNMDCRNMRRAWDDKWQPGRHQNDIDNLVRGILNLEDWIRKNCPQ